MKVTGRAAKALSALLARYGIEATRLTNVGDLDVQVIRIASPAGEFALRIYPAGSREPALIDAEMGWLRAMAEAGLHVPMPLLDCEGGVRQSFRTDPGERSRDAVLLRWLPGRFVYGGLRPVHLERLGALAARMHRSGLAGDPRAVAPPAVSLPDLSAWVDGSQHACARAPLVLQPVLREAAGAMREAFAALPANGPHHGLVHGDLHLWNTLFHRGAAGAIDFSDCGTGPHALDLAAILQYIQHPIAGCRDHAAQYPRLREHLLAGYGRERGLPPSIEREIDLCIGLRMLSTVEWILEDWPRPDHRPWGPRFLADCPAIFGPALLRKL